MSDYRSEMIKMLQNVGVVQKDGSITNMDEQKATLFFDALEAISESTASEDWESMRMRLEENDPTVRIHKFGGHVPIQGEGTIDGMAFYFRARYTSATLKVGTTLPPEQWEESSVDDETDAVISYPRFMAMVRVTEEGDEYGAGWLTPEETEVVFETLREYLVERTHEQNLEALAAERVAFEKMVARIKGHHDGGVSMLTTDREMPKWDDEQS